jgi:hypothetical protein
MKRSFKIVSFVAGLVLCVVAWKLLGATAGSIVVGIAVVTAYRHGHFRNLLR